MWELETNQTCYFDTTDVPAESGSEMAYYAVMETGAEDDASTSRYVIRCTGRGIGFKCTTLSTVAVFVR